MTRDSRPISRRSPNAARTKRSMSVGVRAAVAFAAASALALGATPARAEPGHLLVDWGRMILDLDSLARHRAESPDALASARSLSTSTTGDLLPNNQGNAWFGVAPRVSLVARDWGSAFKIAGDRLSLVDTARLSESTRMIVSRVRLSNTRFAPFTQVGAGQWRTDPNLLPLLPRSTELAAQLGGGMEIKLSPSWDLACEAAVTMIYREQPDANIQTPRLWSTMFASRVTF